MPWAHIYSRRPKPQQPLANPPLKLAWGQTSGRAFAKSPNLQPLQDSSSSGIPTSTQTTTIELFRVLSTDWGSIMLASESLPALGIRGSLKRGPALQVSVEGLQEGAPLGAFQRMGSSKPASKQASKYIL